MRLRPARPRWIVVRHTACKHVLHAYTSWEQAVAHAPSPDQLRRAGLQLAEVSTVEVTADGALAGGCATCCGGGGEGAMATRALAVAL